MGRGEYWRLCDNQGRPPGVLGMWPSRSVTFIDNHDTGTKLALELVATKLPACPDSDAVDRPGRPCRSLLFSACVLQLTLQTAADRLAPDATGSTLNHWPFPSSHLHEAYAYILMHPGTPCVFWDHFMDGSLGETITKLIHIRRSNRINSRSKVLCLFFSLQPQDLLGPALLTIMPADVCIVLQKQSMVQQLCQMHWAGGCAESDGGCVRGMHRQQGLREGGLRQLVPRAGRRRHWAARLGPCALRPQLCCLGGERRLTSVRPLAHAAAHISMRMSKAC